MLDEPEQSDIDSKRYKGDEGSGEGYKGRKEGNRDMSGEREE